MSIDQIRAAIRDIPDFPKPGILFKDITPVLRDPVLFRAAVDHFVERHRGKDLRRVAAIEARGFLLASALAHQLGAGLVPIRKRGKLPYKTVCQSFELEYGTAEIEVHEDAFEPGEPVLLIDDVLATGGTASAAIALIERLGARVAEVDFLIELSFLRGRERLAPHPVYAPIVF